MQDIEKNMDDLFRKAVENYQPKPGESNWDKIASQVLTNQVIPSPEKEKNNIKRYSLILLLLLLFLLTGGLFTKYFGDENRSSVLQEQSRTTINNKAKEQNNFDKEVNEAYKKQSGKQQSIFKNDQLIVQQHQQMGNLLFIKKSKFSYSPAAGKKEIKNINRKVAPAFIKDDPNKKTPGLTDQYNSVKSASNKTGRIEKINTGDDSNKVVNKLAAAQQQHGIYFGGAVGSSFNSVKYQGFRKPGFDIGVITGYQVNNNVSVETGLFFSKKYYYSDGKYFSMDKVSSSMPPEMKIVNLKGSSALFEIPLKVRYNILYKKKAAISSSAGISSYLLTKEKNDYFTSMNGASENITGYYKNSSRYFAAAVDFSVGMEYKFSNSKKIRVEPYIQIPLKGIGMGTLPVMSVGLQLGFIIFPHQ
jgi:hypothetical protein